MQDNNQISINDILAIIELLNIASSRGAFRIEEFSMVGALYQKLYHLVESSGVMQNTKQAQNIKDQKNDETRG